MFDLGLIRLGYLRLMTNEQLTWLRDGDVWQLSRAGRGALRVGERVPGLPGRPELLAAHPAGLRVRPAGVRPLARRPRASVLAEVDVDVLLRFLTACREAMLPGRPGGNVYSIRDGRNTGYAPATINRRLAAISALFAFREMRDPTARNPVPRGRAARMRVAR